MYDEVEHRVHLDDLRLYVNETLMNVISILSCSGMRIELRSQPSMLRGEQCLGHCCLDNGASTFGGLEFRTNGWAKKDLWCLSPARDEMVGKARRATSEYQ
jgi:hypothetical protein